MEDDLYMLPRTGEILAGLGWGDPDPTPPHSAVSQVTY